MGESSFGKTLALAIALGAGAGSAHAQTADASDEIVVTAQRREQNLQDVPIAVTAVSADTLESAGVVTTRDLERAVPGLEMQGTQGSTTPHIRGIGSAFSGQGDENAVALYVDGIYQVASLGNIFGLSNIQRVEVLRGPQGTLFGRNTTGGVIQIITRAPQEALGADMSVSYGNYDTTEARAYLTGGLGPNVAADLSLYYYDQAEGWGTNITRNEDVYWNREFSARSRFDFEVADADVTLSATYSNLDDTRNVGGSIIGLGLDGAPPLQDIFDTRGDFPGFSRTEKSSLNLGIRRDFGWANFVSLSSWQNVRTHDSLDQDATPIPIIGFDTRSPTESLTQEFQLLSPTGSNVEWIVGAFFLHSDADYVPVDIFGAGVLPITPFLRTINHFTTDSASIFGQATFPIAADTRLTAGLRYTTDRQTEEGSLSAGDAPPFFAPPEQEETFSEPTWRLALDHRFTSDLMGYVSYSRGYKSGVFSATVVGAPPVNPEILDAYQAGLKSEWLDGRLRVNGEGYLYNYQDIQVVEIFIGGSRFVNAAEAQIYGADLDFRARVSDDLVFTGTLAYNHGEYESYPTATCTAPSGVGGNISFTCDASGRPMGIASPWSGSIGAEYTYSLGDAGQLEFSADYYWRQSYLSGVDQRIRSPEQNVLAAAVEWSAPGDRWSVRLWGNNLLDETYFRSAASGSFYDFGQPAAPMTYGITLSASFGG